MFVLNQWDSSIHYITSLSTGFLQISNMHTVVELMAERKEDEVRKRSKETPSWAPGGSDYDPNLPYGPKVYLARRKKPDPWWVTTIEVGCWIIGFQEK